MIVKSKIRGFICTTAHPVGCAKNVENQVKTTQKEGAFKGPKNTLIIGGSTGYGLASRIALAFGAGSNTLAVAFEKPASGKRTASAGWYNSAAFEAQACAAGLRSRTLIGDAFSQEVKEQTIAAIKQDFPEGIDCIVYSLAAPRRQDPKTGEIYSSVLKTTGEPYTNKTIDVFSGKLSDVTIEPASAAEIINTQKVMGGEDWLLWCEALQAAGVLNEGVKTFAYSYIGPKLTYPIYRHGTIGKAKEHLERTARQLDDLLAPLQGQAFIAVNKALVTQSSAAIPVVPLYITLLFHIMKEKDCHEGCIEQMNRLFHAVYSGERLPVDKLGLIRMDDYEMREDVQAWVEKQWQSLSQDNIEALADLAGYRRDFHQLFGFDVEGVDYDADVEVNVPLAG